MRRTRSILRGANFIAVAALTPRPSRRAARPGLNIHAISALAPPVPARRYRLSSLVHSHSGIQHQCYESRPQSERRDALPRLLARHYMLGAGIEPAWDLIPRDFKSLASTDFATRADHRAAVNRSACPEKKRSGKRDSNPRPQPWQGCALPTELFPHLVTNLLAQNDANKRHSSGALGLFLSS